MLKKHSEKLRKAMQNAQSYNGEYWHDLESIDGIGPVAARAIVDFFIQRDNYNEINALQSELKIKPFSVVNTQSIITGKTIEEIQGALQRICTRLTKMDNPFLDKQRSYQDFLNVFEAMVGFSHISLKQNIVSNVWKQIQGQQTTISLSAGWTKADKELTAEDLRFENVVDLPHDIFKLIYFNQDQLVVLLNHLQFVIFASDYSAGKYTLISFLLLN